MVAQLLKNYTISVQFPDVSAFEHLEMLEIRDKIAEIEEQLSEQEKKELSLADQILIKNSVVIYGQLSQIIDLRKKRADDNISSASWWWYLDVLANLPQLFIDNDHQITTSVNREVINV
jgi:hypothetical protein